MFLYCTSVKNNQPFPCLIHEWWWWWVWLDRVQTLSCMQPRRTRLAAFRATLLQIQKQKHPSIPNWKERKSSGMRAEVISQHPYRMGFSLPLSRVSSFSWRNATVCSVKWSCFQSGFASWCVCERGGQWGFIIVSSLHFFLHCTTKCVLCVCVGGAATVDREAN